MTITLTSEEAQQVLEALEEAKIDIFDWGQYASHHHREKYNLYGDTVKNDDLIETLRARLAQPEQRTGDCLLAGVCAAEGHRIQKAQREWQGLTTAETKALWNSTKKPSEFAALLQAKLREKNERDA